MAEGESGRLLCARGFIIHPAAALSPAVRTRVHAARRGNEMVSDRADFLWWWSRSLRGIFARSLPPLLSPRKRKRSDEQLQFRIPECLGPGKFDIWGSSHQIFHVFIFILCAMYSHVIALMHAFTACRTLDLCKIKDEYQAN